MIYACTTFLFFCFFRGVFLRSRVTGACPVTTDLIMRVNVGTTTTSVFSGMDLVSGFFQCSIHEDSTPLKAVCTQRGFYEWMVMPMGLASSPGWFQSIMLRVCADLRRVRLFLDDIVCSSASGAKHVQEDLDHFFQRYY